MKTRLTIEIEMDDEVHRDFAAFLVDSALRDRPEHVRNWRVISNVEQDVDRLGV
jgi:hypothetical protein